MIAKKSRKNNKKTTAKKNGYNLKNINTKAKATTTGGKGLLNLFFSLSGFIAIVGGLLSIFIPQLLKANDDFITHEHPTCKMMFLDRAELKRVLNSNSFSDFQKNIARDELTAVETAIKENDCEGK